MPPTPQPIRDRVLLPAPGAQFSISRGKETEDRLRRGGYCRQDRCSRLHLHPHPVPPTPLHRGPHPYPASTHPRCGATRALPFRTAPRCACAPPPTRHTRSDASSAKSVVPAGGACALSRYGGTNPATPALRRVQCRGREKGNYGVRHTRKQRAGSGVGQVLPRGGETEAQEEGEKRRWRILAATLSPARPA